MLVWINNDVTVTYYWYKVVYFYCLVNPYLNKIFCVICVQYIELFLIAITLTDTAVSEWEIFQEGKQFSILKLKAAAPDCPNVVAEDTKTFDGGAGSGLKVYADPGAVNNKFELTLCFSKRVFRVTTE